MLNQQMHRTRLATERVRYVGEPVAVVIATSRTEAADAAEVRALLLKFRETLLG